MCAALNSGNTDDSSVDYFRLSEDTILNTMKRFCEAVVHCFKDKLLRRPTNADICCIEQHYARLGLPGCIGCVDCSEWLWDKCPVGLQGQYIGKEGKPALRLEVVWDDQLWVRHLKFGIPGAQNDVSITNQSKLFNDIRTGKWPPRTPSLNIAGRDINWFYYLADGIYPRFRIFAKPYPKQRPRRRNATQPHTSALERELRGFLESCTLSLKY